MFTYTVLLVLFCKIILVASRALVDATPVLRFVLVHSYPLNVPAVSPVQSNPFGSSRQLNNPDAGNDNLTVILEHVETIGPINQSVIILWTTTEVDWKYLPTSVLDDINHQLKYYYVLLQRKGYSLYKVVKKALLYRKPLQSGYNVAFNPIGNFSINFDFTFKVGTSGNLNFA